MGTSVYCVQFKLQSTVIFYILHALFTFHDVWFVAVIAEGLVDGSPLRQSGFDYRVL